MLPYQLDDTFRITADTRCYALERFITRRKTLEGESRNKATGEATQLWVAESWHGNIPDALRAYATRRAVFASDDDTSLVDVLEHVLARIEHVLDEIKSLAGVLPPHPGNKYRESNGGDDEVGDDDDSESESDND